MAALTNEQKITENQGFWDGVSARTMRNKPHESWGFLAGNHPDRDYERGYWGGFQSRGEGVPHGFAN